jgi:hypothetical protein
MQKKDCVELIIGYHQLEGQIVMLKKPLAMLEKCCTRNGEEHAVEYKVMMMVFTAYGEPEGVPHKILSLTPIFIQFLVVSLCYVSGEAPQ